MTGFETSDYGVTVGDAAINDFTVRLVMRADTADWLQGKAKARLSKACADLLKKIRN